MRRLVCIAYTLVLPASFLAADFTQVVEDAESLRDQGKYADARDLLLDALTTVSGWEASELYERASQRSFGNARC